MKKLSFFLLIAVIAPFLISFAGDADYGRKLKYGSTELYYTDKVTKKEAKALGEYLVETNFTKGEQKKTVQLTKEGDVYQFRMVVKKGYLDDAEYDAIAASYAYNISKDVFDGKEVEIHFCDDQLGTKKVVEMYNGDVVDEGLEMLEFDGTEIEYDKSVAKSEVKALGNYLIKEGFTDGTTKSIQFIFENDTYVFRMVVSKETAADAEYEEIARSFANAMSTDLFDGAAVEIHLCDEYFIPYIRVGLNY
jgi:hypothetical protein